MFHTLTYGAGSGRANAQPAATLSAAQQPHIAALMQVRVLVGSALCVLLVSLHGLNSWKHDCILFLVHAMCQLLLCWQFW